MCGQSGSHSDVVSLITKSGSDNEAFGAHIVVKNRLSQVPQTVKTAHIFRQTR
jgi:hypothetical protein